MTEFDVRIVRLEPMRVACAHGFGASPETEAASMIQAFAESKGLSIATGQARWFGFNNPDPSPGSPNYGYDVWLTVGPGVKAESEIKIIDFSGGLYAVAGCKEVPNLGKAWKRLVRWQEDSPYKRGHHQCLEELLTSPNVPLEEYIFDLYLPIAQ